MSNLQVKRGMVWRQDRDGWMHVALVMTLKPNNQQANALYCHSRPCSLCDNILAHVPVDC